MIPDYNDYILYNIIILILIIKYYYYALMLNMDYIYYVHKQDNMVYIIFIYNSRY